MRNHNKVFATIGVGTLLGLGITACGGTEKKPATQAANNAERARKSETAARQAKHPALFDVTEHSDGSLTYEVKFYDKTFYTKLFCEGFDERTITSGEYEQSSSTERTPASQQNRCRDGKITENEISTPQ